MRSHDPRQREESRRKLERRRPGRVARRLLKLTRHLEYLIRIGGTLRRGLAKRGNRRGYEQSGNQGLHRTPPCLVGRIDLDKDSAICEYEPYSYRSASAGRMRDAACEG